MRNWAWVGLARLGLTWLGVQARSGYAAAIISSIKGFAFLSGRDIAAQLLSASIHIYICIYLSVLHINNFLLCKNNNREQQKQQ